MKREKQACAFNEYTKRTDGGYVLTYFHIRQLPADRIVPVSHRIAECTGEAWRGVWNDATQAERMREHFVTLEKQGATHIVDTMWSVTLDVKWQHYNTTEYPERDASGARVADKREQYCEPQFDLPSRARELDASYRLLQRMRRAVKHWDHPQALRDALTRMRAVRVHSLTSGGYNSDWCVMPHGYQSPVGWSLVG